MIRPRIKICCIQDRQQAALAIAHGADAIGLVALGLSGPEVLPDAQITHVAEDVPPGVTSFLLTREQDPHKLVAQALRCKTSAIQIVDRVPIEAYGMLRKAAPNLRIVQVIHVVGPQALAEALDVSQHVDALILDSGTPSGDTPVYGGTGATHDWSVSASIVQQVPIPVWLAGGINESNLIDAWETVRPWGIDLCSGVRTGMSLDPAKLERFMGIVRGLPSHGTA